MKPYAFVLPAVLLAASLGAQQQPAPSPSPSPSASPSDLQFPTQVEQVTVDVVVNDKKGNPVTGLLANEFTVLEDGKPQNVVQFESVTVPAQASATPPPRPRISTNTAPELPHSSTPERGELSCLARTPVSTALSANASVRGAWLWA